MKLAIDIDLPEMMARIVDGIAPTVRPALTKAVETLKTDAKTNWPVGRERGRAHSRDMFVTDVHIGVDLITARLANKSHWAKFIKSEQGRLEGRSAYVRLIRTPARRMGKRLAVDLSEDIAKLAGK